MADNKYKSMSQILNDVYVGDTLSGYNSATEVLNAVYSEEDGALRIYGTGGSGGATILTELTDVTIAGVTDGQVLTYNTATSKWENKDGGNVDLSPYYTSVQTDALLLDKTTVGVSYTKSEEDALLDLKASSSDLTAYDLSTVVDTKIYEATSGSTGGVDYDNTIIISDGGTNKITDALATVGLNDLIIVFPGEYTETNYFTIPLTADASQKYNIHFMQGTILNNNTANGKGLLYGDSNFTISEINITGHAYIISGFNDGIIYNKLTGGVIGTIYFEASVIDEKTITQLKTTYKPNLTFKAGRVVETQSNTYCIIGDFENVDIKIGELNWGSYGFLSLTENIYSFNLEIGILTNNVSLMYQLSYIEADDLRIRINSETQYTLSNVNIFQNTNKLNIKGYCDLYAKTDGTFLDGYENEIYIKGTIGDFEIGGLNTILFMYDNIQIKDSTSVRRVFNSNILYLDNVSISIDNTSINGYANNYGIFDLVFESSIYTNNVIFSSDGTVTTHISLINAHGATAGVVKKYGDTYSHLSDAELIYAGSGIYTETQVEPLNGPLGSIASKDFWQGTQAEYDAIVTYDDNTLYIIND